MALITRKQRTFWVQDHFFDFVYWQSPLNVHQINMTAENASIKDAKTTTELADFKAVKHSLHPDEEVVKVLQVEHGEDSWTKLEEKRLVRKIDLRLLWLLCLS
jgi:homoaconitase/3-isopropylmalate dehydratase large subunit